MDRQDDLSAKVSSVSAIFIENELAEDAYRGRLLEPMAQDADSARSLLATPMDSEDEPYIS